MFQTKGASRVLISEWRPRRRAAGIAVLGLAALLAACGGTSQGGTPTATVPATATPTTAPSTTWRIVSSPNGASMPNSVLSGTSARAASDAWAVGMSYNEGDGTTPLIERWTGSAWQIVASPSADELHDVAAVSANDAWAVGGVLNYGAGYHPYKPLIERWNGSQWTIVSSPDTGANAVELEAVTAVSANEVWAVGVMDTGAQHMIAPLIERWNGSAWQIVPNAAQPAYTESRLVAVAAVPGSTQLWAVGNTLQRQAESYQQVAIERWNGSAWQNVQGPSLPSGALGAELKGVVAIAANDAWAVGDYTASNHTVRTLIVHWDGTSWQVVASPDTWGSLASVAASKAGDVRAVGYISSGDGNTQAAFVEQWDGTSWKAVTPPTPSGSQSSRLSDVTTDGAGAFWAAGSANVSGAFRTLIETCP